MPRIGAPAAARVSHLSHLPAAGETAKTPVDGAFVSPVSPVSLILKIIGRTKNLIGRMKNWNGKRDIGGIKRHQTSFAETGETGAKMPAIWTETTGARHT